LPPRQRATFLHRREEGLRHDYQGRSSAPGSLALWTHNIRPDIKLTDDFVPDGCKQPVRGKAVTFGAGQQFGGLYEFADKNNLTIIGGISSTVGTAGGWISGAGHSQISNTFGLGVDNVLQIRTVLPNGTLITANECQNQDIWFALRGGGGGTFGVNYEMTSKALPATTLRVSESSYLKEVPSNKVQFASMSIDTSDPAVLSKFFTILIENANRWADEGWSGHIYGGSNYSDASGFNLANPLLSLDEAKASMQPVFNKLSTSLGSNVTLTATVKNYDSFYKFWKDILVPATPPVGIASAYGGRLVPASHFKGAKNQVALRDALLSVKAIVTYPTRNTTDADVVRYGGPFVILVVTPYKYPVTAANDTSSIHPAWRDSIWSIATNLPFSNQASADETQRAFQSAHEATEVLRAAIPHSGTYSNEADLFETDHTSTFWGAKNYKRLLSIKKRIDPGNLLTCWHCVGYNPNDARYQCYPSLS
jgi:FAD/FMN-containing dehydrogenase